MLHHGGAGNRERLSELARGHWGARQALENGHPNGLPEQGEHAQGGAKICGVGVGFSHGHRTVTPD